jgi:L-amino acid N-acyltransferase YncA
MVRSAAPEDAGAIARIYNHYVLNTWVTFEEETVSSDQMRTRIVETLATYPWLVYEQEGQIEGYAYASRWHARRSYRRSVETTVYLDHTKLGGGRGSMLYVELIRILKQRGFHTAIGGIALPNAGSVALHERLGFQKAAHYKEVGWKFEQWIDVGYW